MFVGLDVGGTNTDAVLMDGAELLNKIKTNWYKSVRLFRQKKLNQLDWFVLEGVFRDLLQKYHYSVFKYTLDSFWNRILLLFIILIPTKIERRVLLEYLTPSIHKDFIKWSKFGLDIEDTFLDNHELSRKFIMRSTNFNLENEKVCLK